MCKGDVGFPGGLRGSGHALRASGETGPCLGILRGKFCCGEALRGLTFAQGMLGLTPKPEV